MSGSTGNPQVPQGVINLVRASVQVANFPALNVTASFLGAEGSQISWGSPASTFIRTLTGRVVSLEPFQEATITLHLVRSQVLAQQWENQRLLLALLGPLTVYTDAAALPVYNFSNCAIENVGPITSNGKSAEYMVTVGGTYIVNNALFSLVV